MTSLDKLVKTAIEHARKRKIRSNFLWCVVFDIIYVAFAAFSITMFLITIFSNSLSSELFIGTICAEVFEIIFLLIHSGYFLIHLISYSAGYGLLCLIFGLWLKWEPITNYLAFGCLLIITTIYSLVEFLRELRWTLSWRKCL